MKHLAPIICLLMAAFAIIVGAIGADFRLGGFGGTPTSKLLPTWIGRVWFFGFAAIMLYLGVKSLR